MAVEIWVGSRWWMSCIGLEKIKDCRQHLKIVDGWKLGGWGMCGGGMKLLNIQISRLSKSNKYVDKSYQISPRWEI